MLDLFHSSLMSSIMEGLICAQNQLRVDPIKEEDDVEGDDRDNP